MDRFAPMPAPPYYAVIFANQASSTPDGYGDMAAKMAELARAQPGFIGLESSRDAEGFAITVSYWQDEAAIRAWRENVSHLAAQKVGKARWYEHYRLRVARVERAYEGPEGR
ncbi:MAG: antibiotic biosynthesis monooxygenase [Rhodobacteraceae bacterium]|nr:antibiotic biosynthesis monooxygenase [Paracoccaceae bacterium]